MSEDKKIETVKEKPVKSSMESISKSLHQLKKIIDEKERKKEVTAVIDVSLQNDNQLFINQGSKVKKIKVEVVGDNEEIKPVGKIAELLKSPPSNRRVINRKEELLKAMEEKKVKATNTSEQELKEEKSENQEVRSEENNTVASATKTETTKPMPTNKIETVKPTPTKENATVELIENDGKKKILYVFSESQPFIATGGLADVAGSLPKAVKSVDDNFDTRVVLPFYNDIKYEYKEKCEHIAHFTVHLGWRQEYAGVFKLVLDNVVYYFIDNEKYFKRAGTYGYFDDGERFAYFSKAVTEMLAVLNFYPDIIHCNDWHTALVPVYIRTGFYDNENYRKIKIIYTIHNIEYQGKYGLESVVDLFGIDKKFTKDLEFQGDINLCKAAIIFADVFTTVSRSYSEEIKGELASHGLSSIIIQNQHKMRGIINGVDYEFYNPATDKYIYTNFDKRSFYLKAENKVALQKELSLPLDSSAPIFCMASRLVYHKGIDLVQQIFDQMIQEGVQFLIVGDGDKKYIDFFKDKQNQYPNNVRSLAGMYSNEWARKFYAGSDLFIMPSINEPCGLSQMIASRYGTVPIVREIGGLKDSISDFGCIDGGNGYTFKEYNANDLLYSIKRAVSDFKDKENWQEKIKIVMNVDFSWKKSSKEYIKMYKELIN